MIPLHGNEKLLLVKRRAWFVFASRASGAFLAALLPIFLLLILKETLPFAITQPPFVALVVFGYAVWLVLIWLIFFAMFINYYFDVFIVTSERIIHMMQHGFFHREVAELRLSRMQDVTVTVRGIFATLFRFGAIRVETAGDIQEFTFDQVAYPTKLKDVIMQAHRTHLRTEHVSTHSGLGDGGR